MTGCSSKLVDIASHDLLPTLDLLASLGDTVSSLCLVDVCNAFHNLPIVAGRFSGFAKADRVCTHCYGIPYIAVADELHMIHEYPALQPQTHLGPYRYLSTQPSNPTYIARLGTRGNKLRTDGPHAMDYLDFLMRH